MRHSSFTKHWLDRLQRVECPDTTFVQGDFPIVFKKAKGLFILDVDGRKYLDFNACFGVMALGHRPAVTARALRKQSAAMIHGMGDVHPTEAKIKLLEQVVKMLPCYVNPKVLLGLSGGDAVEAALKTSILYTKRQRFLSFDGGYHGLQTAPLSLNNRSEFLEGFESWVHGRCHVLPFPTDKLEASVLEQLETQLKTREYAALVLEPIQGRGGTRPFSPSFLKSAQDLCRMFGSLLIFDEVFTGFGRTGKMFAFEHSGVVPDLLCLGKTLGGGLPLSACVGDVMDIWGKSMGEARHTQTFLGHPLACHVGYETLLELQKLWSSLGRELPLIENALCDFQKDIKAKGLWSRFSFERRGCGWMHGLAFEGQPAGFAAMLMEESLKKGLIVLPEGNRGDVLALTPPLVAKAEDYRKALAILGKILLNLT